MMSKRDWALLGISVLVAFLLWGYAKSIATYRVELGLPVRYADLPEGLCFSEPPPDTVLVSGRLRGGDIVAWALRSPYLEVRLRRPKLGLNQIPLKPDMIRGVDARALLEPTFIPPILEVRVDREERKKLTVVPRLEGKPKSGHVVVEVGVSPPVFGVGPASVMAKLREVETERVNLRGLDREVRVKVALLPPAPTVRLEPDSVEVDIKIDSLVTRRVPAVPLGRGDTLRVEIRLPSSLAERITELRYHPSPEGPRLAIPKGVEVLKIEGGANP